MVTTRRLLASCAVLSLAACQGPSGLGATDPRITGAELVWNAAPVVTPPAATGGGHYDLPGVTVQFGFSAVGLPDGGAAGQFHVAGDEGDGLTIDIAGAVTCMAVDAANHRAWIGAVVTRNGSTDPDLQTEIHQPGRDVWFRVLDSGEGNGAIDRTSFTGFKGAAGIQTSAEYCAVRLWAPDNARTWPVTGNVSVHP